MKRFSPVAAVVGLLLLGTPSAGDIEEAVRAFVAGDITTARREVEAYLQQHPEDARALRLLTEIRIEEARRGGLREGTSATPSAGAERGEEVRTDAFDLVFGERGRLRGGEVGRIHARGGRNRVEIEILTGGEEVGTISYEEGAVVVRFGAADGLPKGPFRLPAGPVREITHEEVEAGVTEVRVPYETGWRLETGGGGGQVFLRFLRPTTRPPSSGAGEGEAAPPVNAEGLEVRLEGDGQQGVPGEVLPRPLVARVTRNGLPAAGVPVRFLAVDADIEFDVDPTTERAESEGRTDTAGLVRAYVKLGRTTGRRVLRAAVPGTPVEASGEVYVVATTPEEILPVSGMDQTLFVRRRGGEPLTASVTDRYGNPIPGAAVRWTFASGGGWLDADPSRPGAQQVNFTDENGLAVLSNYTMGPLKGRQVIQASVTANDVRRFVSFEFDVQPVLIGQLDFYDVSIIDVLQRFGEQAGWNIVLSDGVLNMSEEAQRVTVHFENAPADEALSQILALKGLTRTETPDGTIKIMTFEEAVRSGHPVTSGLNPDAVPEAEEVITHTARLRNAKVATLSDLSELLSPSGKIITDAGSNSLIITDYASNVRKILRILAEIDQESFAQGAEGRYLVVYNLKNITAAELEQVVSATIDWHPPKRERIGDRTVTIPSTEQREIFSYPLAGQRQFVAYTDEARHRQLAVLIQELDSEELASTRNLSVKMFRAERADAEDLAEWFRKNLLNSPQFQTDAATLRVVEYAVVLDTAVIFFARPETLDRVERLWTVLDRPEFSFERVRFVETRLVGPGVASVANALRTLYPGQVPGEGVEVIEGLAPGLLLLTGDPSLFDDAEVIIRRLEEHAEFVVEVYTFETAPLGGLNAAEGSGLTGDAVKDALQSLIPQGGGVFWNSFAGQNAVLVYGSRSEVERFLEACRTIDEAWMRGWSFEYFPLRYVTPERAGALLTSLLPGHGLEIRRAPNGIFLSSPPGVREKVLQVLPLVDTTAVMQSHFAVVKVRGGQGAGDLAGALRQAFGDNLQVVEVPNFRSILISGPPDLVEKAKTIAERVDEGSWKVVTYRLRWSPNQGVLGMPLSGITQQGQTIDQLLLQLLQSGGGGIYANVGVNAFTIYGVPEDVDKAVAVLKSIDDAWKEENNFEIVPLKYRSAQEIRQDANNLLFGSFFEFVPLDSINAILLVGVVGPEGRFDYFRRVIQELDTTIPSVPVRVDAEEAGDLQTFLSAAYSDITVVPISGVEPISQVLLVLRGRRDRLDAALADIGRIMSGEVKYRSYAFDHAPPDEVFGFLRRRFRGEYIALAESDRERGGVLMVWADEAVHSQIPPLLAEIDHLDFRGENTRVFEVVKSNAADLTNAIRTIDPTVTIASLPYNLSGSRSALIVSGEPTALARIERFIRRFEEGAGTQPFELAVYRPRYRTPAQLQADLSTVFRGADLYTSNDAVLMYGDGATLRRFQETARALDVERGVSDFVPLTRTDVSDVTALLDSLYGSNLGVIALPSRGAVLLVGDTELVREAREKIIDIERGMPWRIFRTRHMTADEIASAISSSFRNVTPEALARGRGVAVFGPYETLEEVAEFVRKTDTTAVRIVFLREIAADDVTTVLNAVYPDLVVTRLGAGLDALVLRGAPDLLDEAERFVGKIDRSVHTAIRPLKYYNPTTADGQQDITNLETLLETYLSGGGGHIEYDRQANAFLITASLGEVERILEILDQLDRTPPQFIIEAVVAEVNLRQSDDLGVTWALQPGLSSVGIDQADIRFIPTSPALTGSPTPGTTNNANLALAISAGNLQATMQALVQDRDVRIISSPKVVTRNNVGARISVGSQEPVISVTNVTAGGNVLLTTTFQDVPISLRVTPTSVTGSDIVRLTVEVNVSVVTDRVQTGGGGQAPVIDERVVQTTVDIRDGYTLILGGLISENESLGEDKVPFLGDIPGLGALFRSRNKVKGKQELIIFLSPRILTPENTVRHMETELARYEYLVNFPVDWTGRRFRARPIEAASGRVAAPAARALGEETPVASRASSVRPVERPDLAPQPAPARRGGSLLDLNTATAEELAEVPGLTPTTAELIVAYREENGPYAAVSEIRDVPGVSDEAASQAEPYLTVSPSAPPPATPVYEPAPTGGLLDLNTATVEELMQLPLEEYQARMIVAYRNTYGGFARTEELLEVPGITPSDYERVRDRVTVRPAAPRAAPRVDVNTATEKELASVEGMTEEHARLIVAYRQTYGPYKTLDDLLQVPGITPEVLSRIRPGLTVGTNGP